MLLLLSQTAFTAECLDTVPEDLHDCLIGADWEQRHRTEGISIYSRNIPGSNVREVRATAHIQAPAKEIYTLLTDFDRYTTFMPSTLERCELLHRESDNYWVFQQLNLPFISDRYYTIRLQATQNTDKPGRYNLSWQLAEDAEYRRTGLGERVAFNNGFWSLSEQAGGTTLVQYYIHTDPGRLWGWVVDLATQCSGD
jgi:carbon monoxide dehydrogenase subunit G